MVKKKKSKLKVILKIILLVFLILVISGVIIGYNYYKKIYYPNVEIKGKNQKYLYVPTGSSFEELLNILDRENVVKDINSFEWLADIKDFNNVKPGKYLIKNNMSNNELVNLLRAGLQSPVNVTFNNIRTKEQLVSRISSNIEADSLEFIELLNNEDFVSKYGFNTETIVTMFIPNTYEFFWNTSVEQFFDRMATEYKQFWTDDKKQKARNIGLSQSEVSILASIVQQESQKKDEKPTIAGVYLNRLKKGMLLQADPTVIFAIGDFSINRVLKVHLQYNSPYNTYIYTGLPPGPICIPSISSIDAVLNYEKHDYYYFCAKEDFSGYHNFAKTLDQHNVNARKFQKALNKRKIMN